MFVCTMFFYDLFIKKNKINQAKEYYKKNNVVIRDKATNKYR